ncbi:MAG: hypothetical protein U1E17_21795 [Geminicoccaceae bacterium]
MIARPVGTEPVKSRRAPAGGGPGVRAGLLTEAGDDIEHARRQAHAASASSAKRRAESGVCSAGLSTAVQPAARAGPSERAAMPSGVVPGHDVGGDAQGLHQREVDHRGPERDGGALHLVGRTGIVDQGRDHAVDVALRLLERLADIGRLQRRQLLLVRGDEVGKAQQQAPTRGRRDLAPVAVERVMGGADGGVDVGRPAAGDLGDRLLGRRVDGGEALARGGGDGAPGDEQVGLHEGPRRLSP